MRGMRRAASSAFPQDGRSRDRPAHRLGTRRRDLPYGPCRADPDHTPPVLIVLMLAGRDPLPQRRPALRQHCCGPQHRPQGGRLLHTIQLGGQCDHRGHVRHRRHRFQGVQQRGPRRFRAAWTGWRAGTAGSSLGRVSGLGEHKQHRPRRCHRVTPAAASSSRGSMSSILWTTPGRTLRNGFWVPARCAGPTAAGDRRRWCHTTSSRFSGRPVAEAVIPRIGAAGRCRVVRAVPRIGPLPSQDRPPAPATVDDRSPVSCRCRAAGRPCRGAGPAGPGPPPPTYVGSTGSCPLTARHAATHPAPPRSVVFFIHKARVAPSNGDRVAMANSFDHLMRSGQAQPLTVLVGRS